MFVSLRLALSSDATVNIGYYTAFACPLANLVSWHKRFANLPAFYHNKTTMSWQFGRFQAVVVLAMIAVAGIFCLALLPVSADTLQSNNYKFDETDLGGGGLNQSSSPNFQSILSVGDNAVGDSASTNFQTQAGSLTSPDPALTFIINSGAVNFGTFSPSLAATATSSFSIINYTSYGYIVQVTGAAPTNGSHTISPMLTAGASSPGGEQFGINLVANTSPTSVGANPVQGLFGAGVAATGYNTPNSYQYINGDTIASAPKSSGITTYTISYLVNVNSRTPGGQYTSDQQIIVVGTY
jgi:hypothetical protein